ncbi:MAG TPA: methyltransferase domain-containing protein [Mycobacteriales bacterium]|nr:methyltransferase domain-containing protein [Mycobacteriales bacterium]
MSQPAPVPAQPRWDARLYADNTGHHRRHDDDFLRGVAFRRGARVLDIGCGVGDLTARLAQLVRDGDVLGVDADPDMVATARARAGSPVLRFAVGRAQELHRVVPAASVDIAVSVACLHWVPAADHPGVLAQVRRVLRGRGVLRAEFGGSGQIAAVRALLDEESARHGGGPAGWCFPTPETYSALLADAGFDVGPAAAGWVRLLRQRRRIPDESAFVGWLRSQVLAAYDPVLPAERVRDFRRVAEDRALAELRRADGSYDQDYVRLDLLARSR